MTEHDGPDGPQGPQPLTGNDLEATIGREFEPTPTGAYKKALRRVWDLEDRLGAVDDKQGPEASALLTELESARSEAQVAWQKLQERDPENAETIKQGLFQERTFTRDYDEGPEEERGSEVLAEHEAAQRQIVEANDEPPEHNGDQ